MEPDDRQHGRSPAKLEVEITAEESPRICGTVQDVSLAGLYVSCAERLPVGAPCALRIQLPGDEDDGVLEATGRIAHVEPDGMGIQLTDLPVRQYGELRRLVARARVGDA